MTDPDLFAMGCGIAFVALGGAYAFLRERFLEGTRRGRARIERERRRAGGDTPTPARRVS